MTVFVIAIGVLALVMVGFSFALASTGDTRQRTPEDHWWNGVIWLAIAGGAAYVLLV